MQRQWPASRRFNRAEEAIAEKNLDALVAVFSERYRYQAITKADRRKI
jgi:hypothetical protein